MTFFKINVQQQNQEETEFDIESFNNNFENMTLISKLDTSEHVTWNNSGRFQNIVDPKLSFGINWYNMYEENYVDPMQDSVDRLSLLVLLDKFHKKILIVKVNDKHLFFIPGGRPKIFETSENAAVRNFESICGFSLNKNKLKKILCEKIVKSNQITHVSTYVSFHFEEKNYHLRNINSEWVSIALLRNFNSGFFNKYYKLIYFMCLQHLY